MDKRQYFLAALQNNAALYKAWVLSTFAVIHKRSVEKLQSDPHPFHLIHSKQNEDKVYFKDPKTDEWGVIEGAEWGKPIFDFDDPIHLEPGDLPNVTEAVDTTYGNALFNAMVIVYAFGSKMKFKTGAISGSMMEKEIGSKLKDTPDNEQDRKDEFYYVDELLRHNDAVTALSGFAGVFCPAASEKSMTIDPAIIKRRDQLLKENKDKLNDPAVIAAIEKELVEMDIKSFENDPAKKFYIKDKTYAVSRKRCFIMFGVETGFDTGKEAKLIVPSLKEGWDLNNLPGMVESLRAGSYNRGHETALGGESVKYFYRIFQNTRVLEEDCNTTKGLRWKVTLSNLKKFIGLHPLSKGETKGYTEAELKQLVGKEIVLRSPLYCKTKAPSFCAKCVGDSFAANPTGLHTSISDVGSRFLYVFMLAMHGKALRTAEYRIANVFS